MSRPTTTIRALLVAAACLALTVEATAAAQRRPARRATPGTQAVAGSLSAGEPISLDLKDADVRDVLRTFAQLARVNIAIDPDVKGSVTVRLHDVPWEQALEVILRVNGLGYVLEGSVIRVGEPRSLFP